MDFEILSWFANFLNFLIFLFLAINIFNTMCFNVFQMTLSVIGLFASIFIQIIVVISKRVLVEEGRNV
jgi:hypothetical protein